jgi:hypothetical protein
MEGQPENPIESRENDSQKIESEQLIALAKEKAPGDPEVREMLIKWLEQTRVPEGSQAESIEYIDVSIMHSAMKYRLGFISKEEVLEELELAGGLLAGEYPNENTKELHRRLSQLLYAIEDDTFELIKPAQ